MAGPTRSRTSRKDRQISRTLLPSSRERLGAIQDSLSNCSESIRPLLLFRLHHLRRNLHAHVPVSPAERLAIMKIMKITNMKIALSPLAAFHQIVSER